MSIYYNTKPRTLPLNFTMRPWNATLQHVLYISVFRWNAFLTYTVIIFVYRCAIQWQDVCNAFRERALKSTIWIAVTGSWRLSTSLIVTANFIPRRTHPLPIISCECGMMFLHVLKQCEDIFFTMSSNTITNVYSLKRLNNLENGRI